MSNAYIYMTVHGAERKVAVEGLTVFEATEQAPVRTAVVETYRGSTVRTLDHVFIGETY